MNGQRLTEAEIASALRAYLPERAYPGLAERVLDAVAEAPQLRALPSFLGVLTTADPIARRRNLIAAAAVLVALALLGAAAAGTFRQRKQDLVTDLSTGPTAQIPVGPSPAPSQTTLPHLHMPGTRANVVDGDYGWTGSLGSKTGMHSVVTVGSESRMTQLVFAVARDCFARDPAAKPAPATVAGIAGMYAEPYVDRGALFMPDPRPGETTGAYALPFGGRTLCVYLTWDRTTTSRELDAAREVVESIRGQPFDDTGIRIIFTLPAGWDTG